MVELVRWCNEVLPEERKYSRIIFNPTGGFKGLQGVLNSLGMFYADEIVYMFEHSPELIRIPRLPLRLDVEPTMERYLPQLRRMHLGLPVSVSEVNDVPETLLLPENGGRRLSAWGEVVWFEEYGKLYRQKLLQSPIDRIRYGHTFSENVSEYAGTDHMLRINERVDDLVRFLQSGHNARRLDLKAIENPNRVAPSTHECDAWDTLRLFCHWEDRGRVLVLDRLASKLR